jgi:hypothetical protein
MAVNAGPYVSWGLYKANNLPLAFVRWWIDGPPVQQVVGGLKVVALGRLTRATSHVITKGVAIGRVTKITWGGLSYRSRSRR